MGQALLMDYSNEVPHSELLLVRGKEPFNAEPKASALVEFAITPDDLVYCRNHGPVEDLDARMCLARSRVEVAQRAARDNQQVRMLLGRDHCARNVAVVHVCDDLLLAADSHLARVVLPLPGRVLRADIDTRIEIVAKKIIATLFVENIVFLVGVTEW